MLAILKSRWFLALVGLILLGLLIWFGGPYLAFGDYHPFESVMGRVLALLVIVLIYVGIALLKQMNSNRASQKLAAEVAGQDSGARAGSAEAQQLKRRFEEAVEALRKSRKKGARNLYELPWYMIIGPPGSGKTTVLVNSGLNFPLAQKFGKEALRGVGGTRNCDWWFTDQAILLDTAGRYTTQDSNADADAGGWKAFLQLLRKYRRRQPINGVIVAISASDLLTLGERDRERHVAAIRERLDELNRELRIEAPVYVLVTKCDLIAGFSEFFDDLNQDTRAQVWGTTFPLEVSRSGQAADGFPKEFERLLERLQSRVIDRVEQERDPRRRTAILAFPQQVASLKPLLSDLLRRVFSQSGFDSTVLLRGVYFTSGTQEGTPIDRMLGAIARNFGFTSAVAPSPAGQGKAYFIERLLKKVVFQESGIAGVNLRLQLQKALLQSGAYLACAAIVVIGVLALIVSYRSNASYVEDVSQATQSLTSLPSVEASGVPVEMLLPRLDAFAGVVKSAERYKGDVPVRMRVGLYRGNALGESARDAYLRELNATLLPLMGRQFEQRMLVNSGTPDQLYEYLKAYLMLGDSAHRDADHLRFLSRHEWQQMIPDAEIRQRVTDHFEQLLADPDSMRALPLNAAVIQQARTALRTASIPVLMYSRLKLNYVGDAKRALRLDMVTGAGADLALVRKSGAKLSDPIPAIYTRAVFSDVNSTGKLELIQQFAGDSWVFGDNTFDLSQAPRLAYQVMQIYEADYIRAWDAIIADVGLAPTGTADQLTQVLSIVSSPSSPLKGFLNVAADNTNLLKQDDAVDKAAQQVAAAAAAKAAQLSKMFGGDQANAAQDKPGARCTAHFEPLRKLTEGPPGSTQIDRVLGVLAQTNQALKAMGSGLGKTSSLEGMTRAGQADTLQALQLEAKQLPPPLNAMIAQIGGQSTTLATGAARTELQQKYNQFVRRECSELIEGRYPFDRGSAVDVPLADFGRVFGYGGVFDNFFRDNLAALVDVSRTPWRWREGAGAIGGSASLLNQFQLVQRIREVYFKPGGQLPEVRFNVTPDALDAQASRFALDIDGQMLEYRHGPQQSRAVTWPGGAAGQSSVVFEERGGSGPSVAYQGPWAWFRILDKSQLTPQSDTRFLANFSLSGHSASVVLEATSIRNPFAANELGRFRCTM
ncbi:MAG TPA: type VI secretion system membrane subunit TssM [Steroidobacteraceae bacterium]|nr:type VI secretion system membrane subunit TssM [Steroidobacteraceae bacterium]